NMRQHELSRKKCMAQMVLLVVLGVVISTFLLGAAISAIGHVTIIALLKDLGTSNNFSTIIKGESLMNDGVALGLAFGIASLLWMGYIFDDAIIQISLTLAVRYIAFFAVR
uniref:Cation/H+ exchanger transmembrane domain-containing protein n=2 Tax=Aegilops tauschii subsp. strangulata TaxID=200361 RepID=A0A453R3X9_AEGTS